MSGQYLSTSKYFITRGKCVPSHRLLTLFICCVFVRLVCFVSSKTANSILWIPVLDLKVLTKFYCNFSKCLLLDADSIVLLFELIENSLRQPNPILDETFLKFSIQLDRISWKMAGQFVMRWWPRVVTYMDWLKSKSFWYILSYSFVQNSMKHLEVFLDQSEIGYGHQSFERCFLNPIQPLVGFNMVHWQGVDKKNVILFKTNRKSNLARLGMESFWNSTSLLYRISQHLGNICMARR